MMKTVITKRFNFDTFPILYERGRKKAVLIDIEIFEQIKMIVDNILNRNPESEDKILSEAKVLEKIILKYENINRKERKNWRKELDEL